MHHDALRKAVAASEIEFRPASPANAGGRVFQWQGGEYQVLLPENERFYRDLLASDPIENLLRDGKLIETRVADIELEDHATVLEHRRVPFVSYAHEWCFEALKDAALLVLDVEERLAPKGLTLHDAHPSKVLFDGCRPVLADFCTIERAAPDAPWEATEDFRRFFLNPLILMANRQERIARLLLNDPAEGVSDKTVSLFLQGNGPGRDASGARPPLPRWRRGIRRGLKGLRFLASGNEPKPVASVRDTVAALRRELEAVQTAPKKTRWSDYYDTFPPLTPSPEWSAKHASVADVLAKLRPRTVQDVASNRGWYSLLAAKQGSATVSFDTDETSINRLYADCKTTGANINPLVMNVLSPSPGYGVNYQTQAPATERLRCELVLALALVHHLVFKQQCRFETVVDALSAFAERWLLVEFIPRDDEHVAKWCGEGFEWYTLDNFKAALSRTYRIEAILPSAPKPRVLFLCEKRSLDQSFQTLVSGAAMGDQQH